MSIIVTDLHLSRLCRDMATTADQAYRPATKANHRAMFRTYIGFCMFFGLRELNPHPSTIALYIQFLTRTFQSPQSIRNYTAAINLLHQMNDLDPPKRTFATSLMLRAINLTLRHIVHQMLPITTTLLHKICDVCDTQGVTGRTIKAAILLLFFTFL
jgi:hypothetical protein